MYDKLQTVNPKHVLFGNIICLKCCRLDYLFISNNMQKLAKKVNILNALSANHFPLFCSVLILSNISRGYGVQKFNNSLIWNTNFLVEKKTLIQKVIFSLENDTFLSDQVQWELQKYEIRRVGINFSRKIAQNSSKLETDLETECKNLEQDITDKNKCNQHRIVKNELEKLYHYIASGVKTWSKSNWCLYGEKFTKYLDLEKQKAVNGTV